MCDQGRGGALPPSVRRFSSRQTKLCGFFEENFYFLAHGEELIFLNKLFDVVANVNLNFFFLAVKKILIMRQQSHGVDEEEGL